MALRNAALSSRGTVDKAAERERDKERQVWMDQREGDWERLREDKKKHSHIKNWKCDGANQFHNQWVLSLR